MQILRIAAVILAHVCGVLSLVISLDAVVFAANFLDDLALVSARPSQEYDLIHRTQRVDYQ